jgi:hypothetical protein
LVRHVPKQPAQMLLRFVERRPVSTETMGHWFSVMGIAKCRRLAGKPS